MYTTRITCTIPAHSRTSPDLIVILGFILISFIYFAPAVMKGVQLRNTTHSLL